MMRTSVTVNVNAVGSWKHTKVTEVPIPHSSGERVEVMEQRMKVQTSNLIKGKVTGLTGKPSKRGRSNLSSLLAKHIFVAEI